MLDDISGAGGVPGGVAAGFEGRAQAAGGEAAGIGLALDQFLAAEFGDGAPAPVGLRKLSCFSAVMPVIGWNRCV